MSAQGTALLFSGLGLALYTGARLGIWARSSSVVLANVMGPARKQEAVILWLAVAGLLAAAAWILAES